jgi:hypothetical protein
MISTVAEALERFEFLADGNKIQVMGRLSYDLTIRMRDLISEPKKDDWANKLEGINEIQHKALGQLLAYLAQRQQRYADKDIFILLLKLAKAHDVLGSVQNSLFAALESYS